MLCVGYKNIHEKVFQGKKYGRDSTKLTGKTCLYGHSTIYKQIKREKCC